MSHYNAVDFDDLEENPIALTLQQAQDVLEQHGVSCREMEYDDFPLADRDGNYSAAEVFLWLGY